MRTTQYDLILSQLSNEMSALEHQVFSLLKANPDGLTRLELLSCVYGPESRDQAERRGLANSADDRKIREAIEQLRNNGIPVVSSSGAPGYRLDTSTQAISAMIAEWQSRINQLQARINMASKFYDIPHEYNPIQGRLI